MDDFTSREKVMMSHVIFRLSVIQEKLDQQIKSRP